MNTPTLAAAFVSAIHPSPLVAEYYVLGDAEVIRVTGEATYSVDHPLLETTDHFDTKDFALQVGAAWVRTALDQGFQQQQEPAYEYLDVFGL